MPNQLKPKKLDLPHLHPCSHRLQKTLQGRFGKARHTAERRTQSQPGNWQGCVAVSVKGERGHFRVAAFTLSNADLYQHGSLHRAKQSDLGILNLPSPKQLSQSNQSQTALARQTFGEHPPPPIHMSNCSLLLFTLQFPEWLKECVCCQKPEMTCNLPCFFSWRQAGPFAGRRTGFLQSLPVRGASMGLGCSVANTWRQRCLSGSSEEPCGSLTQCTHA